MDFLAGYPVLPTQRSILSRVQDMNAHASETNVRNAREIIVRMKPGKIVSRYILLRTETRVGAEMVFGPHEMNVMARSRRTTTRAWVGGLVR